MANWKRVVAGLAAAFLVMLGLFLVIVAMQPNEYRVTRTATIKATPAAVFSEVNDFHNWEAWSPWAKLDPNATVVFEGPTSGEGAKFNWSGNDRIGEGSQTIVESKPHERIRIRLQFERPMQDAADVEFTFTPSDDATQIEWTMSGKKNFMDKAVCIFMNMDRMIGSDFEKGLANLKMVAEKRAEPAAKFSGEKEESVIADEQ